MKHCAGVRGEGWGAGKGSKYSACSKCFQVLRLFPSSAKLLVISKKKEKKLPEKVVSAKIYATDEILYVTYMHDSNGKFCFKSFKTLSSLSFRNKMTKFETKC